MIWDSPLPRTTDIPPEPTTDPPESVVLSSGVTDFVHGPDSELAVAYPSV